MYSYYQKLQFLKGFLLMGEGLILLIRLVFQVLFTLPSALLVMQVFMSALIYSRRHCQAQAQLYIIINCILFYFMAYNQIFERYYKLSAPVSIVENFNNGYKTWGYAIETVFRMIGTSIAWRCYQFSKIVEDEIDEQDDFI